MAEFLTCREVFINCATPRIFLNFKNQIIPKFQFPNNPDSYRGNFQTASIKRD
jgi:hypothetical protein